MPCARKHAMPTHAHKPRPRRFTIVLLVALGFAAAYLGAATWLWNRTPTIDFDPLAQLQADTPQAPEGERAWPAYRNALAWLRLERAQVLAAEDPAGAEALHEALLAEPGTEAWPRAVAMLDMHASDMHALHDATAMRVFGYVPSLQLTPADAAYFGVEPAADTVAAAAAPSAIPGIPDWAGEFPSLAISLPYIEDMQGAVMLLHLQALRAAEQGQGSRAVDAVQAIARAGSHVSQVPVLIGSLVQLALQARAADTALKAIALNASAFSAADLLRLDSVLAATTPETTRLKLAGERMMMRDVIQRLYSNDGTGNGSLLPATAARVDVLMQPFDPTTGVSGAGTPDVLWFLAGPYLWATAPSRMDVVELWSAILDEAEAESMKPAWDQDFPSEAELMPVYGASGALRMSYLPIAALAPAVSNSARASSRTRVYAAAVRAQIAIERYRRDAGAWPASLEDLVPKYLAEVPRDEFGNVPLQYSVQDDKPRVTSVGPGTQNEILLSR